MSDATTYRAATDELKIEFMKSLAKDLRFMGHEVTVRKLESCIEFEFIPKDFCAEDIRAVLKQVRDRELQDERDFMARMEEGGIANLFIDGQDIDIDAIQPELRICKTGEQKDIYRYCRNLQSVPTSTGVGRRFSALVYDVGQSRPVLMGVFGLAGTSYYLTDRDGFLGWQGIDSRSEERERRNKGLKRLMQLAVFLAVRPYNELLAGKLMLLLALSDPIQSHFQERYDDPLLGLVTTSATREDHCPVCNRIELSKLPQSARYKRDRSSEMYVHIGSTSEYTTVMLSDRTVESARNLVRNNSTEQHDSDDKIRSSLSKGRVIPKARRLCGIDRDVFRLGRKALYFGYLHEANLALLSDCSSEREPMLDLPVDDAVSYWKDRWLERALEHQRRIERLRDFSSEGNLLSNELITPNSGSD